MKKSSDTDQSGLCRIPCDADVETTVNHLVDVLNDQGFAILARVNHAAAAAKIGEVLGPTELVLFGKPQAGTPLMQTNQTVGIDLPQKMLIWEDAEGKTWIAYNDPCYLSNRHDIDGHDQLIENIKNQLESIAMAVRSGLS
ncbi:MAG: DUF302 domain-containing protein [Gammaproteobacteria bacterium]|nr:DUF302 domain-containing protein [Gammaproteobacteria bacterium]